MSDRTCTIGECEKPLRCRGMCETHYSNMRKHGTPYAPPRPRGPRVPVADVIAARSRREGDCLIWTGGTDRKGYGELRTGGKTKKAHRLVWEIQNGEIPDGIMLDHICHNKACIEVRHLRFATNQQNQMNRRGPNRGRKYDLPRGVYMNPRLKKPYLAIITKDRKLHNLGAFATLEEAHAARLDAENRLFGAFAGA